MVNKEKRRSPWKLIRRLSLKEKTRFDKTAARSKGEGILGKNWPDTKGLKLDRPVRAEGTWIHQIRFLHAV